MPAVLEQAPDDGGGDDDAVLPVVEPAGLPARIAAGTVTPP